jgi:FkbM family methyltransferase
MRTIMSRLFTLLPRNNEFFYRVCKKYVDRYNNENNSDIHTNGELRFINDNLCNCDVVFDVGANVGDWAKLALGINPNISLHCFEPSSSTFKKLVGNDFPANVICNNFGLGAEDGERKLFVFGDESGGNSMYKRKGLDDGWNIEQQQATEVIKLTTIDNYCHNNIPKIDLLKIDVEGYEFEVLKGAANLLKEERIKMIQFEYGGCYIDAHILLKDIFEYLESFNYNISKLFVDDLRLIKRYDQRLENFQYSNYVAILNGHKHI